MSQLTIEDIARIAGVSRSTVSRVLNGQPNVRPSVRDRVQEVINSYGYAPQAAARQLVMRKTRLIGLILPDNAHHLFGNPIFAEIARGMSQVCAQRGYTPMLFIGRQDMDEATFFSLLRGRHFDGVLLISSDRQDRSAAMLREAGMPYVRVGHDPEDDQDLQYVDVDNVAAARVAVEHLIALGHRRIAMLKGLAKDVCTHARLEGYRQALTAAGIPFDEALVGDGDWTPASGYTWTRRFLDLPEPPTALFSSNDMMVAGVVRAVQERGLKVPDDLAIVGFDDLLQTTMIFPELTTIRQPCVEMGMRAAELLLDQLEHNRRERAQIILPTTLIIRESCGYRRRTAQLSPPAESATAALDDEQRAS
jgi:DNA-binding LacI/PurR family transcriptional regulator